MLAFTRRHEIDDKFTLDVTYLIEKGIATGEFRSVPSPRTMARIIIAASNEAALFVGNARDPDAARAEAVAGIEVLLSALSRSRS